MKTTAIVNANALTENGFVSQATVLIRSDRIAEISQRAISRHDCDEIVDLDGEILAPGLIDGQVNGGGGVLFNDDPSAETAEIIAKAHRKYGTTSLLPTLISDDLDKISKAIGAIDEAVMSGVRGIAGLHIEGPFLNEKKRGVHDASKIRCLTPEAIDLLTSAQHAKVVVTLAPELATVEQIQMLVERGVRVCAGHTNATYEEAMTAIAAGVTGFTHLFNAMSPLQSRSPGIIAAALESDTWCGIIVDGKHVHPAMLRLALRAKTDNRFMLVTDAMPGVGADIDHFFLNGRRIEIRDGACVAEDGTLAGASLSMVDAVKNSVDLLGLEMGDALTLASANPAAFLGIEKSVGSIAVGKRADLVQLTSDFKVERSWISGEQNTSHKAAA